MFPSIYTGLYHFSTEQKRARSLPDSNYAMLVSLARQMTEAHYAFVMLARLRVIWEKIRVLCCADGLEDASEQQAGRLVS